MSEKSKIIKINIWWNQSVRKDFMIEKKNILAKDNRSEMFVIIQDFRVSNYKISGILFPFFRKHNFF